METAERGRPSCCIIPCLSARLASNALMKEEQQTGIRESEGGRKLGKIGGQVKIIELEGSVKKKEDRGAGQK